MFPIVTIQPTRALELSAAFGLGSLVLALAARRAGRSEPHLATAFSAYLLGALALSIAGLHLLAPGPLNISSYAVSLVIGALLAWLILLFRLRSIGLPPRLIFYILFGCLVVGVAGARLAHVLAEPSQLLGEAIDPRRGGLGIFGALTADAIFITLLFRRHPEHSLAETLDAGASAVALNVACGRVGCWLAGCCFGAPETTGILGLPLSSFAPGTPARLHHASTEHGHLWPTQPMEVVAALAIAIACEVLWRRRERLALPPGLVAAIGMGAYGLLRSFIEAVRADSAQRVAGIFTVWQICGATLFLGAATWAAISCRGQPSAAKRIDPAP